MKPTGIDLVAAAKRKWYLIVFLVMGAVWLWDRLYRAEFWDWLVRLFGIK